MKGRLGVTAAWLFGTETPVDAEYDSNRSGRFTATANIPLPARKRTIPQPSNPLRSRYTGSAIPVRKIGLKQT